MEQIVEKYINPLTDFGFNAYRDIKNSLDTAKKEGIAEGVVKTARNLKQMGIDVSQISKATGLSIEEIEQL